ncbi:MAG: hypothetical protein PUF37_01085 [Prevotellaceae bacterium]|nr:hypothetical protein [Prevotellaceae bacterium]
MNIVKTSYWYKGKPYKALDILLSKEDGIEDGMPTLKIVAENALWEDAFNKDEYCDYPKDKEAEGIDIIVDIYSDIAKRYHEGSATETEVLNFALNE